MRLDIQVKKRALSVSQEMEDSVGRPEVAKAWWMEVGVSAVIWAGAVSCRL